jgi:hypothetical protein
VEIALLLISDHLVYRFHQPIVAGGNIDITNWMFQSARTRFGIAVFFLVTALFLLGAEGQRSAARSVWPKSKGEYIATSSERIPLFPRTLSGYRSENDKDFWNKSFPSRGSVRVFEGRDWQGLQDFPNTMNGCAAGVFMIRWRLSDPEVRVQSSVRFSSKDTSATTKSGSFGYMSGATASNRCSSLSAR